MDHLLCHGHVPLGRIRAELLLAKVENEPAGGAEIKAEKNLDIWPNNMCGKEQDSYIGQGDA